MDCRNSSLATLIPPTPWMPSIITAQIFSPSSSKTFFNASILLKGKIITLEFSLTGATIFGLSVTETAKEVLP